MTNFIKTLVLSATLLAGAVSFARAQEVPEPRMITLTSGILCASVEEVESILTRVALQEEPYVQGKCWVVDKQVLVLAVPLHWYDNTEGKALVASYTHESGTTMYGFLKFVPKAGDPA